MTTTRGGQHRPVRRVLAGAVVALLLVGCGTSAAKVADIPTSLKPTAPPEPDPVEGVATFAVESVSNVRPLGLGSARPADDEAIQATVDTIAAWLDAHLDTLHRGEGDVWADMAADGLVDEAGHVTAALASPERHITGAAYVMTVHHDGAPRLVAVEVTVVHRDGGTGRAQMLFAVDGGEPVLTLFGPGEGEA